MTFAQPATLHASRCLLCRVPQEAPQEVAELVVHCTKEESADRPSMSEVLQRLGALHQATAASQGESQRAAPPSSPGRSSQGKVTNSSSMQTPAWAVDLKILECRVPQEAPHEVAELEDQCTQQEPADPPTMLEVLQRLHPLPSAMTTKQWGPLQLAAPPLSSGRSSQGKMMSSSSMQAPKIDPKDLEFCKDKKGKNITLGMGAFGQVTHRLRHSSVGLCPPETASCTVLSNWCNTLVLCLFVTKQMDHAYICAWPASLRGPVPQGQTKLSAVTLTLLVSSWVQPIVHLIAASPLADLIDARRYSR